MIINPSEININEYEYELPDSSIALYPASERDSSKLLTYRAGSINENRFANITDYIPKDSILIFNDTKVIQARLIFQKETGSEIEIFCLEPVLSSQQPATSNQQKAGSWPLVTGLSQWNCIVGNAKRWKSGKLIKTINSNNTNIELIAEKDKPTSEGFIIKFSWRPENLTFSEILEKLGKMPLPPYIKRDTIESDKQTYQTVYARHEGSVAAPTAGLHFTENILNRLGEKNIKTEYITLHVGTGTFKPVTSETIDKHEMHKEVFSIEKKSLQNIINNLDNKIIPVGTTSLRTLESLYWLGVKLTVNRAPFPLSYWRGGRGEVLHSIEQWDPYQEKYNKDNITPLKALSAVIEYMEKENIETLWSATSLMIVPGYKFRITKGLITNFHQPRSTLLLLIAAFIGDDWKKVYDYALTNNFRFLSYGDCCLFI